MVTTATHKRITVGSHKHQHTDSKKLNDKVVTNYKFTTVFLLIN